MHEALARGQNNQPEEERMSVAIITALILSLTCSIIRQIQDAPKNDQKTEYQTTNIEEEEEKNE